MKSYERIFSCLRLVNDLVGGGASLKRCVPVLDSISDKAVSINELQ